MKTKAFSLIEMMIVVAIVAVLSGFGAPSLSNFSKTKDYKAVSEGVSNFFSEIALKAYIKKEIIDIEFDYNKNLIIASTNGVEITTFSLPKRYKYSNTTTSRHFTEEGNISPMFSFVVQESNGDNVFKLTCTSTDKYVQSAHIRKYSPKNSEWEEMK